MTVPLVARDVKMPFGLRQKSARKGHATHSRLQSALRPSSAGLLCVEDAVMKAVGATVPKLIG